MIIICFSQNLFSSVDELSKSSTGYFSRKKACFPQNIPTYIRMGDERGRSVKENSKECPLPPSICRKLFKEIAKNSADFVKKGS